MGERVSKYEIGLTVDENDTDALYQAICQLTTIQQQESNFNLRFDFATYRQVHSHSQLQQSFATLLSYS
jgi:hypothetical protein